MSIEQKILQEKKTRMIEKRFFHFKDGVRISDAQINTWLREVQRKLEEGSPRSRISSGDTEVIGFRWSDSHMELMVANSDGHSSINIFADDGDVYYYYERPLK